METRNIHDSVMTLEDAGVYEVSFDAKTLERINARVISGFGPIGLSLPECYVYALMTELVEHGRQEGKKELRRAVNELCLWCGNYQEEHKGMCGDCRWKDVRLGAGK